MGRPRSRTDCWAPVIGQRLEQTPAARTVRELNQHSMRVTDSDEAIVRIGARIRKELLQRLLLRLLLMLIQDRAIKVNVRALQSVFSHCCSKINTLFEVSGDGDELQRVCLYFKGK